MTAIPRWHLIACQLRSIYAARARLVGVGVETYLPETHERVKVGREMLIAAWPRLFQYAFVRLTDDSENRQQLLDEAAVVLAQRGVMHLYSDRNDKPIPIPNCEIAVLQQIEANEMSEVNKSPSRIMVSTFPLGSRIKIIGGEEFIGREADLISGARGKSRVAFDNGLMTVVNDFDIVMVTPANKRRA